MAPPPRIVTLVVDDPRGALPAIEVESPWWMESGPVVAAALDVFGLEVTVVRLLSGDAFPGGPVTYLVEAPDVDSTRLLPWPAKSETGGVTDDPLRAHYAEVGAINELIGWADGELADHGRGRSGPVEQVRTWNLSCLLRFPMLEGPAVWLKAVPEFFAHEPEVIRALASIDPTLVPEVVATRPGATLMVEEGDRDGYGIEPDRHFDATRRFVVARRDVPPAALAAVPRFGPAELRSSLADLAERDGHQLEPNERAKLVSLANQVEDRWSAATVEATLVHGDLHGGNLRLSDTGPDVIIDWGDATISHPLFDLAVLDSYVPEWKTEATDRWLDLLGLERSSWEAFRPLAAIRLAVVYRGFCDRIETSERIYHRNDIVPAIRRGLRFFDS